MQGSTFYEKELTKASESEIYKIERVLKKRKNEAYIKWLNWPSKYNSWIKIGDLKSYIRR